MLERFRQNPSEMSPKITQESRVERQGVLSEKQKKLLQKLERDLETGVADFNVREVAEECAEDGEAFRVLVDGIKDLAKRVVGRDQAELTDREIFRRSKALIHGIARIAQEVASATTRKAFQGGQIQVEERSAHEKQQVQAANETFSDLQRALIERYLEALSRMKSDKSGEVGNTIILAERAHGLGFVDEAQRLLDAAEAFMGKAPRTTPDSVGAYPVFFGQLHEDIRRLREEFAKVEQSSS